jgi:hypothetical protein
MRDIKITLSTSASRAGSIQDELDWLKEEGELWYPVSAGKPQFTRPGLWVYFIRDGHVVARAPIASIDPPSSVTLSSYSGEPMQSRAWQIRVETMELAVQPIRHLGFQGFRYVTDEERALFESAFPPTPTPTKKVRPRGSKR